MAVNSLSCNTLKCSQASKARRKVSQGTVKTIICHAASFLACMPCSKSFTAWPNRFFLRFIALHVHKYHTPRHYKNLSFILLHACIMGTMWVTPQNRGMPSTCCFVDHYAAVLARVLQLRSSPQLQFLLTDSFSSYWSCPNPAHAL
jgi:hypothetical protein